MTTTLHALQAANAQKELQEQLTAALKRISELEEHNEELQDSINNLEKSFQSLLETARAEIRRKDAKIAEARKEYVLNPSKVVIRYVY